MSQPVATLFTEDPAASDAVRTEHIGELESVIALARDEGRREGTYWRADHASALAFARSQARLRRRVMQSLGLPLPRSIAAHPSGDARHQQLGEDEIATYYRAWFPVLPGLHAVGLLIVPHELQRPAPLVVALHGGSGSPEIATFVVRNFSRRYTRAASASTAGSSVSKSAPSLRRNSSRISARFLWMAGTRI